MTIKRKTLLWFIIPSVLITTIMASVYYFSVRKTIEQNIFDQMRIAVNEGQGRVRTFLEAKRGRTIDFSSDGYIRDITEKITMRDARRAHYVSILNDHLMTNKKPIDPGILEVFVVDLSGKVIASTYKGRIGEDVSNEEYFTDENLFNIFAGEPYFHPDSNKSVVYFSTMLFSRVGHEAIGVIVNRIEFEQIDEWDYEKLVAVNKVRVQDFSSDGFIRDCTEDIVKVEERDFYYSDLLSTHLSKNKQPLDSDILSVIVVGLDGKVISSTEFSQIGRDMSDDVVFTKTVKRGSCVSELRSPTGSAQNAFFDVSRLLLSTQVQDPIGIIINRYKADSLRIVMKSGMSGAFREKQQFEGMGETGELYIVNSDKIMITDSRFVEDVILKQVVDTEGVRAAFDNGVGMFGIYTDYRGISILGVSRYFEDMNWVILAEKDVSEAFAPLVSLKYFTVIVMGMSIILIVVVSIIISTGITKPIRRLITGTKRIAGGDLEHPIIIKKMDGEMKELGESFNIMMRELGKSTSENKRLFLQVKKGRDEWRNTFDAITDIITIHDENHKIIMANRAFYEKFKIDKKELPGKKCFEIFLGTDSNLHCCPLDKSKKSSQPESEIVDDPHMGGVFIKSTYPMKDEKGEIYAYVHLAKDITLQKELQTELIEKARELEKANKEMEDFVYLTSHDLKEPLFVIGGFASRLSAAYNDVLDDRGRRYVRRIKANAEKMNQRIHEIMDILKAGRVEYDFKDNNSGAIVEGVIHSLQDKISGSEIKVSVQDNLPTIFCDNMRMKDVFANLFTNAIKFMGNGNSPTPSFTKPPNSHSIPLIPPSRPARPLGRVRGNGDKGGLNKEGFHGIKVGCEKNGEYYKFFVEDTGIGIHADYQKQIFKMFKRLNDLDVEGTGVGLPIVKKIIEQHKGDIWVESPVCDGRGSRFCFTIPVLKK